MEVFWIIVVLAVVAIGAYIGHVQEKKRLKAYADLAQRMGFLFEPERDSTRCGGRYDRVDLLQQGSNRYMKHRLSGHVNNLDVLACNFHYETHSTDSKEI